MSMEFFDSVDNLVEFMATENLEKEVIDADFQGGDIIYIFSDCSAITTDASIPVECKKYDVKAFVTPWNKGRFLFSILKEDTNVIALLPNYVKDELIAYLEEEW